MSDTALFTVLGMATWYGSHTRRNPGIARRNRPGTSCSSRGQDNQPVASRKFHHCALPQTLALSVPVLRGRFHAMFFADRVIR